MFSVVFMWKDIIPLLISSWHKLDDKEAEEQFLKYFYEALESYYNSRSRSPDDVHVSTINKCHKKAVYETMFPTPLTGVDFEHFITGEAIHKVIQTLGDSWDKDRYIVDQSKYDKDMDLTFSVDLFDKKRNIPLELKTVRKDYNMLMKTISDPTQGLPITYLLQLALYLIATNTNKGLLYYNLLAQMRNNFHHVFSIELPDSHKNIIKREVTKAVKLYKKAVKEQNPDLVEGVYDIPLLQYQCAFCPYADPQLCKEGYEAKKKNREEWIKNQKNNRYNPKKV